MELPGRRGRVHVIHGVQGVAGVARVRGIAVQHVGEARDLGVLLHGARRIAEHAHGMGRRRGGDVAPTRVAEPPVEEIHGVAREGQPAPLTGGAVERDEGLAHGEAVIEKRPAHVLRVVPEPAARQGAMREHPLRGAPGRRQRVRIAGDVGVLAQRADRPAVLARVLMGVDARGAEAPPRGVIERVVMVPGDGRGQVRVLAHVERASRGT